MVSVKLSFIFWGLLVFLAQFQCGHSFLLGFKKELLKHKIYKLKEALEAIQHDDHEEVHHYHYKPYYVSSGYSKWSPSYSSSSYGWPSYSGWSGHY